MQSATSENKFNSFWLEQWKYISYLMAEALESLEPPNRLQFETPTYRRDAYVIGKYTLWSKKKKKKKLTIESIMEYVDIDELRENVSSCLFGYNVYVQMTNYS